MATPTINEIQTQMKNKLIFSTIIALIFIIAMIIYRDTLTLKQ